MLSRLIRRTLFASSTLLALIPSVALAGDVTWTNSAANLTWDTSSLNFTGAAWKNSTYDGAIFGATGTGSINVNTGINLHSLNVTSAGYTFGGAGSLNFSQAGSSTLAAANATPQISSSATLALNTTVTSTTGLTVFGAGTITLGGSGHSITGITSAGGSLGEAVNLQVGSNSATTGGGFLNLGGASVLPASTRLGIGSGVVDIGTNNVTLNGLTFSTTSDTGTTQGRLLGTGGGTVTFTDDIRSIGNLTGFGNQIAANVNIPSGTQIVRIGSASNGAAEIVFTGVISGNGGLLKTYGNTNSTSSFNNSQGGFALIGNNTYTGPTVLSGNTTVTSNVVAGTNASTTLTLSNIGVSVLGANGSYASVTTVNLYGLGNLLLTNTASVTASNPLPAVAAANLNNRLGTTATINMQGGLFQITGANNLASNQQVAALNLQNGFNTLTLGAGTGTGTSIFSATGNLTITPGATVLFRSSSLPDTTAGAQASTAFTFAGTTPGTVGSPGIIVGAIGAGTVAGTGSDFVRYVSAGNVGIARLAAAEYTANYTTTGANVSVGAAQTVAASITVNAIRSGAFTTTINDNQTVTVTSGMILATGTTTFAPQASPVTPGILAFGGNTGYFFSAGGSITASVPLSGSAGIIKASGNTLTLSGNNTGLTGGITVQGGTLAFTTNTATSFGGSLNVQVGAVTTTGVTVFNNTSAINLGLAVTPDQVAVAPATISLTGLTTGTNFTNAINTLGTGGGNAASLQVTTPSVATFTLSGALTLGNNLTIAGAPTTTLNITGPITGNAGLYFTTSSGTVNISNSGNTFSGTLFAQGAATINLAGSTGARSGGTTISAGTVQFNDPANLGSGTVTMIAGTLTSTAASAISLNNTVYVGGSSTLNTGANNLTLAGALNGLNSVTLTKTGAGTLLVTGAGNFQGNMTFGTGTGGLTLNGNGALPNLGAVSMGNSTVLNVDNSAVNIARTGFATNLTLTNGGVAGTGPVVNLTTNAAGSTMNFGTLTVTGGTAGNPNVSTINLLDSGAGNNSINFLSLANIAANNTLNFAGTTNFGQSAASGTHLFFAVAPTLTGGVIANTGFTGSGGSGQATYDATFGVILYVAPVNASGTVIDNINAPQLTTNTNFTTTGDTTAKTGAKLNSLTLDVGNNLNLVQTYAAAPGNGGGVGNGNTPIDTLLLSNGQLTVTATGPKTITASTTGVVAFGVTNAAIAANSDLTVAASVTFSGTGGLTKTGTGNFTMNGTNSLSGDYNLSAGNLTLNTSASGVGSLTSAAGTTLTVGSGATVTSTTAASTSLAGTLAGSGNIIKAGGGTLTISGSNAGFTGNVTVTGGNVQVADLTTNLGTGAAILNLNGGGLNYTGGSVALTSAQTPAVGAAGGTINVTTAATTVTMGNNTWFGGNLTKSGPGTLTMQAAGNITTTGNLVITNGNFDTNGNNLSIGALTFGDGTATQPKLVSGAGVVTLGGNVNLFPGAVVSQNITTNFNLGGAVRQFIGNGFTSATAADYNFSGVISGAGGITTTPGTGSQTWLAFSGANTFTGTLTHNSTGQILLGAVNTIPSTVSVNQTAANTITQVIGTAEGGLVTGNFAQNIGSLAGISGSSYVLGTATLTTGNNNTDTNYAGVISGTGGLTKVGTGAQTLSGANTYTGPTNVNGGKLIVNGSLANTAVTVAPGATLGGSGTITGSVTVNGVISPGNSPGKLSLAGSISLADNSSYVVEIASFTGGSPPTAGTDYDQIALTSLTGTYTIGNNVTLAGIRLGGFTAPFLSAWTILSNANTAANSGSGTFAGINDGDFLNFDGQVFQIRYNVGTFSVDGINGLQTLTAGGSIVIAAVPEPATIAMLTITGVSTVGYVVYRRRRNTKKRFVRKS